MLQVFLVPEAQLSPGEQEWGRIESSSTRLIATVAVGQCIRSSAHAIGRYRPCLWIGPRRKEAECIPSGPDTSVEHGSSQYTRKSMLCREYTRRLRMQVLYSQITDPRDCPCKFNEDRSISTSSRASCLERLGVATGPWGCRRGLILSDRRLGPRRVHKCVGGGARANRPTTLDIDYNWVESFRTCSYD